MKTQVGVYMVYIIVPGAVIGLVSYARQLVIAMSSTLSPTTGASSFTCCTTLLSVGSYKY